MKTFYTDNAELLDLLEMNEIEMVCGEDMQIYISDEDADRIPVIVAEYAPGAMLDYTIE